MDKRVPWLCSAMAIVAAACSSNPNTSGDGGTSATGSVDSACSDAANKVCNKLATCSPLILKLVYTDMNGCNGAWKAVCLSEANANGSMLTSDAVQMCGQGTDRASCSDAINSVLAGTLPG